MAKYLNYTGLQYFYNKLKQIFASKAYSAVQIKNGSGTSATYEAFDASSKSETLCFDAGNNVTLSIADNNHVVITATDTKYTPASVSPKMDGAAAVGSSANYAREDHVHPSDTSRVPTSRKVNGHALSADITVSKSDIGLGNVDNTADANKSVASAAKATALASYRLFDGVSFNGSSDVVHFALYDSTSPAISVSCTNFQYQNGARIHIYHNQQINSGNNKTLNVESNGAVPIRYKNSPVIPTIPKGTIVEYIYYSNAFHIGGLDSDTTYSSMSQSEADGGSSTTGRLISASVLSTTIANAVAGVTQISYQIVDDYSKLPTTGAAGVIYLIKDNSKNTYKEYIWITDKYELLGDTAIEIEAITNAEIDSLFA